MRTLTLSSRATHDVGSTNINTRGESLLECLAGTGLQITNRGGEPTFCITNRVEVADLTLGTPDVAERIK